MSDWSAIESAVKNLGALPERFALFLAPRAGNQASQKELMHGLEIAREGLVALGGFSAGEPTVGTDERLAKLKNDFVRAIRDRRAVTTGALQSFLHSKEAGGAGGATEESVGRFVVRSLFGTLVGDLLEEVPFSHQPDPEDLRGLALRWFEDNALLLRESDQIACFWVLGPCLGHQLIPIATRLYHHPSTGPEFAETMEEIFGPEIFDRIRAGG